MGLSYALGNFASPSLTRLNVINVLEDEGFVNTEEYNYRSNQRRVSMAIGHKDVCALARHLKSNAGWIGAPNLAP